MNPIEEAKTALRASRDALKAELEADPRWHQMSQLNSALAALGDKDAALVIPGRALVDPEPISPRPPVGEIEDLGTYPLLQNVMSAAPNRIWKVSELESEMTTRGWETDAVNKRNALGTALLRLNHRDKVEKVGRGKYRWGAARPAPDSPVGGGESVTVEPSNDADVEGEPAQQQQPQRDEPAVDFFARPAPMEAPMSG